MKRSPDHHADEGTERVVLLLKSHDYEATQDADGRLPYRVDQLGENGWRPIWTDQHLRGKWWGRLAPLVRRTESLGAPWAQTWSSQRLRTGADATMAIFESEGHALAGWRLLSRRNSPPLVVVGCWLADLLNDGSARRRLLYRTIYRSVDRIIVFSANQRATLQNHLGVDPDRIAVVRFGVDLDDLENRPTSETRGVVAAGRDLGRDWATLAEAVRKTGIAVDLITRDRQLVGIDLPPEVEVIGLLDRHAYLDRLASATVVAIPTDIREYPTGQTVLLEAMALGKACIVTDTPAMREYVDDGVTAVLVPVHDPAAWRRELSDLFEDPDRRRRLGDAARARALEWGGARRMWHDIGVVLTDAVRSDGRSVD